MVKEEVLDDDDYERLLAEPGGNGWSDQDLDALLRRRLGQTHSRFIELVGELQDNILSLSRTLGVDKPRFQAKMKQMQVSLLHRSIARDID